MPAFVNVKKKGHLPAREKISFSVDGYDVVFISFICADFGAQVENVAADCAGVTIGRRTPEGLIQFLCGKDLFRMFGKKTQQRKFCSGQTDIAAVSISMPDGKIQHQAFDRDLTGGLKIFHKPLFPRKQHLNDRQKFIKLAGLCEIVVAAFHKTCDLIFHITLSGEKQNRTEAFFSKLTADVQTVTVRQQDIENEQVGKPSIQLFISFHSRLRGEHLISSASQHPAVDFQYLWLILDH